MPTRHQFLLATQNPDGGWGYFPGKRSWTEPTVYAALALHGTPASDRAWTLIRSWALPAGGWRASADIAEPNWTTALCVTLYCVRGLRDDAFNRGIDRLLASVGGGGSFLLQLG